MTWSGIASVPKAVVRDTIDEVLEQPEFRSGANALAQWFSETFRELLRKLSDIFGIDPGTVGTALVYIVYGLLFAALAWIIWRIVRARLYAQDSEGDDSPEIDPQVARRARVAELRRGARAARERNDLVLSLRLYFTALVVGLGEKGDLAYRDAWTNRELLERGEPRIEVERRLSPLVRELDAKSFGGVPATAEDVDEMAQLVDELLGAERA
ncbi:MAG: hypothetical protein JNL28_08955 [Planctomycetes bacterium]|nr:hypothetical protein [Planctomycetota bacterium]